MNLPRLDDEGGILDTGGTVGLPTMVVVEEGFFGSF
jgi:hypothetical protein